MPIRRHVTHGTKRITIDAVVHSMSLRAEFLPGYSPDLNPVESLCGNSQELANRCVIGLGEAEAAVQGGQ